MAFVSDWQIKDASLNTARFSPLHFKFIPLHHGSDFSTHFLHVIFFEIKLTKFHKTAISACPSSIEWGGGGRQRSKKSRCLDHQNPKTPPLGSLGWPNFFYYYWKSHLRFNVLHSMENFILLLSLNVLKMLTKLCGITLPPNIKHPTPWVF